MRKPRLASLGLSGIFHKMWRGHNREFIFQENCEKAAYLDALNRSATDNIKQCVKWHAFCLMGNHTHELGTTVYHKRNTRKTSIKALSDWMRNAHSRFGAGYNRRHDRQGKVAYDRPKTTEVHDQWHLLKVMFYLDANPVRAGICRHPAKYAFSTHRFYANGKRPPCGTSVTPPEIYLALGKTPAERQKKYRQLCDMYLREQGLLDDKPSETEPKNTSTVPADIESQLSMIDLRGSPPSGD